MDKNSKIFVAGHESLVGAAIIKLLSEKGFKNILTKSFAELEKTEQKGIYDFLTKEKVEYVLIAGMKMCQAYDKQYKTNFISVIPANVFGPGDDFDPQNSHVVSALIRNFHEAKIANKPEVVIWGTGKPRRDFIFVDAVADACIFLMEIYNSSDVINVGTGNDLSIGELAKLVKDVVSYNGEIKFDTSKPDGMPRKALDSSRLAEKGWKYNSDITQGLKKTYEWYLKTK
ncbi:MAG: NAD-dependent epimerase/dehydratase family protein [DPANN group archaeon]|nr:NAD-dependent epimerase/dehydratase family protein [DPANN group archaeon]